MVKLRLIRNRTMTQEQQIIQLRSMFFVLFFLVIAMAGGIANLFVITLNDSRMPVLNTYTNDKYHFGYFDKADVRMWHLSDIIHTPIGVLSIGDVFIIVGVTGIIVLIVQSLKSLIEIKVTKYENPN